MTFRQAGQVRVFNVHILSKLAQVQAFAGTVKKGAREWGGGGGTCSGGYKGVRAVRPLSVQTIHLKYLY